MADNLIFPIGFDLDKGIKEAIGQGDKGLKRLEAAIAKHPITVKVKLDTGRTRGTQSELVGFKKQLAELTQEWNKLTAAERGGAAGAALRERYRALQREAQGYVSTLRAAVSQEDKLAAARDKAARAAERGTTATRNANKEFHNQDGYISRLIKRLAVYASFSAVNTFLTSVREVTAQFELQRVSLGAIIQDQTRANALFSEIKQFALKSPISIMDLTKYTKQVAAYRIETDKLFDTTKRLADVSVGLGVDMGRLVLAYGQVKAASYLRAAEIRQFTEAGIPMLELLAEKFTKLNGEAVTTEQVMEMVSKRMVGFEMVEDIFNDMTSAGGMFYNMQEKQGNTLFGLWAKLGDAASVMYDQIGNTEGVNEGMKSLIELLTDLMRNWKAVADTAAWVVAPAALTAMFTKYALSSTRKQAADEAATAATKAREAAESQLGRALEKGSVDDITAANAALLKAKADEVAARKATTRKGLLVSGFKSVAKSLATGLGIGIAITAVTNFAYKLFEAYENAHKLENALNDIEAEGAATTLQSVRNFEFLANAAVNAADGSKAQKDALDELHRTYKDMIPAEDLTIEKLRAMHGNYQSLTAAIREYIAEQNKQKKISAIQEIYGTKIQKAYKGLREYLLEGVEGFRGASLKLSDTEIERFFIELEKRATDTSKTVNQKIRESLEAAGVKADAKMIQNIQTYGNAFGNTTSHIEDFITASKGQTEAIEGVHRATAESVGYLGKYKETLDKITESSQKYRLVDTKGEGVKRDTFLFQQGQQNFQIKEWAQSMKTELEQAGVTVQDGIFNLVQKIEENDPTKISTIDFSKLLPLLDTPEVRERLGSSYEAFKNYVLSIQEAYEGIVPSNPIVQAIRNNMLAIGNATQVGMDKMKKYLWDGKGDIKDHLKTLKESAKGLEDEIYKYSNYIKLFGTTGKMGLKLMGIDVDALAAEYDGLTKHIQYVQTYVKETDKKSGRSGGTRKSAKQDPRLQNLKEEISLVQKLYKDYQELEKQMGATAATAEMRKLYPTTFDTLTKKFEKYGAVFRDPFNAEALIADLQALRKHMATLPTKTFKTLSKDLEELDYTIEHIRLDELSKKIEAQLKELADRISRTKTAREFYDKILGMTGDIELAANVSLQIYGSNGRELDAMVKEQFQKAFESISNDHPELVTEVNSIIDRGAYEELRGFIDKLPKDAQKAAEDLVKAQQQMSAKQYEQWLKDLEKAKDYADKRIELSRYTANQIEAIEKRIAKLDPAASDYAAQKAMLEKMIQGYKEREEKEAAKIEYDMFKDMPIYVQMFDNLDNASTTMLNNMLNLLKKNKEQWGQFLDPTQLKEMQSRMNEIEKQLAARNPFKTLAKSFKDLWSLKKSGRNRKDDEDAAAAAMEAEAEAMKRWVEADKAYQAQLKAHNNDTENEDVKNAKATADAAEEEYKNAKKASDNAQKQTSAWKDIADKIDAANAEIDKYQDQINKALDEVLSMMEALGVDANDMEFFNSMEDGFNQILDGGQAAAAAFSQFMNGRYLEGAMSSVSAITKIVSGISNLFSAGKVRKANKEIQRQEEILERLEDTYSRLEKAADKLFGREYISNYNQQMRVLEAQQSAYLAQAAAERSKGKKADEQKAKEYEDQAKQTAEKIKELQDDLTSHFLGTDRASAAREFARSWIEAKATFASTTDAIKSKYADMIKSMIIEGAAAKIIDNILAPMWDHVDSVLKEGRSDDAIDYLIGNMDKFIDTADKSMDVFWQKLKARGYDMEKILGDSDANLTGISRNIAAASEEDINGLAAGINTQNYYIAQIHSNVATIAAKWNEEVTMPTVDYSALIQQSVDRLAMIERYSSEILTECRRNAVAAENALAAIQRVIAPKGNNPIYRLYVNM